MPTMNTAETRRTADQANYALNRTLENRRIYAEQQVAWFYADLIKAQHGSAISSHGARLMYWGGRVLKAMGDLAEAHANLDSLQSGLVG